MITGMHRIDERTSIRLDEIVWVAQPTEKPNSIVLGLRNGAMLEISFDDTEKRAAAYATLLERLEVLHSAMVMLEPDDEIGGMSR